MKNFTFKEGQVGNGLSACSSFKCFVVMVVMLLMTASSAMAQEVKFEVIDGLRYNLVSDTKTATLLPKTNGKYSGDIVVPEKIKSSDGVEYSVTAFGDKIVPFDNTMKKDSELYQLFNTNFHEIAGATR